MAGYKGYSMSNNAVDAYENGEKPLSKWTKSALLAEIKNAGYNYPALEKVNIEVLRDKLLICSSWHHTSSHYNQTDFYSLNYSVLTDLDTRTISEWSIKREKKEVITEKWECEYLEWSGSRKHPKATIHTDVGEIRGTWFFLPDGRKKSITANGFRKLKKMEQ